MGPSGYHGSMLRHRMTFGLLMMGALIALVCLDDRIDQANIANTWLQAVFFGRGSLPSGLVLYGFLAVLIVLGVRELRVILGTKGIEAGAAAMTVGCLAVFSLTWMMPSGVDSQRGLVVTSTVMLFVFLGSLVKHSKAGEPQGVVAMAGAMMLAAFYLGLLPGFLMAIRLSHNTWTVMGVMLIAKFADIGAYFVGRAIGKHKLIPWLSPGKTWEGFIGGVLFAGVVAVVFVAVGQHYQMIGRWISPDGVRVFVPRSYPLWFVAGSGVLIGLAGQLGDLVVSLFKRDAGIKDSAKIIPGFGGVLDVCDSPLLAGPLAYWLLAWGAGL